MAGSPVKALLPRPEELNRVLITLEGLAPADDVAYEVLGAAAASYCFGSRMPEIHEATSFAAEVGLIRRQAGRVSLTELGGAFLAGNPGRTYELTEGQARFIATNCLLMSPYRELIEGIFSRFRIDQSMGALTCDLAAERMTPLEVSAISHMRAIGMIRLDGSVAVVQEEARPYASLLSRKRQMSPEELQELLQRRQIQGTAAEHFVLNWERSRLRDLGCDAEADGVLHLSEIDVCAGYDISSFDGKSRAFAFDRFIEVKSTTGSEPQFVLSRNELEVARELGKRYWLYVVCRFGVPGMKPSIWTLRDPANELAKRFDLECLDFKGTPKSKSIRKPKAR